MIQLKFGPDLLPGGRETLAKHAIPVTVLTVTGPHDCNRSVRQDRDDRINLVIVRVRIYQTADPALPDKRSAAIFEHGHARVFLIARGLFVYSKNAEQPGQIAGDSPGADSETVSVRNVVLPDQKATIRSESDLGKHLVARQRPGDGILSSLRRIRVLRQNSRSNSSKQDPKNKRLPRAQR